MTAEKIRATSSAEGSAHASGEIDVIAGIKAVLAPVFEKVRDSIAAAYLFGSTTNGQAGPASDIDLAVLLTGGALGDDADIRLELYADCCRALKRNDIDIVLLNKTKNLFLLDDVVRNGVVLFDGNTQLREDFEVRVIHDFIDFREHRMKVMGV